MSLALSTSWNSFRYDNGAGIIKEIKDLGFEAVELNFSLTASVVEEIAPCVQKGEIKVVSVHNFCPIPERLTKEEALPDCYSMSSQDEEERRAAIKYTKNTIDTAQRLGAKALVLHCGRVEIPDRTRELIAGLESGAKNSARYNELKGAVIKEREENVRPYLENTLRSLEELSRYAKKKNISLGVENRYYYREIPSLEEVEIILKTFEGSTVFYWHDTGHAQFMENLGFLNHKDYLDLYAKSMLGIHLHDIIGARDHQAPLKGMLDFKMLPAYIAKNTLKVMEVHHPASSQDLIKAKKYLEVIFDGKN